MISQLTSTSIISFDLCLHFEGGGLPCSKLKPRNSSLRYTFLHCDTELRASVDTSQDTFDGNLLLDKTRMLAQRQCIFLMLQESLRKI
jgi:hypothetical protein